MLVENDVPIPIGDGNVLRANVYRPAAIGRFPVILAHGVYGKDTHFADAFPIQFARLLETYPGLCGDGSTGHYLRWEVVDPERFVPDGFVVVNVDARGTGKSPGYLDPCSPREIRDYYEAIEWAGTQPWSNGRVGLAGISYYAFTQWAVAALQPPHLAAILPWEGLTDYYRDWTHHGGIFSNAFARAWWPRQILVNQNGNATTHYRDRDTAAAPTGEPLGDALLAGNRTDYVAELRRHALDDAWYRERTADLRRVVVPFLSAGNWGGPGLHLRGNIDGFLRAASAQKWLSMHVGTHWESFYLPENVALQKAFFGHFLRGDANGWPDRPPVQLAIRAIDGSTTTRTETAFPIERTIYDTYYLDADAATLGTEPPAQASQATYDAAGAGLDLSTAPFAAAVEFTGFVHARVWIASSTPDTDVFAVLRIFDAAGDEVVFTGAHEPTPVTRGWLRASHRKTDPARSLPHRPFHPHAAAEPLTPGRLYELDVELWPTCIVVPRGARLVLTLLGHDFEFPGIPGRLLHDDPQDRARETFTGRVTLATGGEHRSALMLPRIPPP